MGKPRLPDLPNEAAEVETLSLIKFIGPKSVFLFHCLNIDTDLLEKPPPWDDDADYQHLAAFVSTLRVTNDTAEREIRLISDYIIPSGEG